MIRFITLLLLFAAPQRSLAQRVIYVSQSAAGNNDGTSWADAFVFLQDALAAAAPGEDVWVAKGVYRPDQGTGLTLGDRSASLFMPFDVRVFGGFEGTEAFVSDRPESAETVLSGDLQGNDAGVPSYSNQSKQDNSYQVTTLFEVGDRAVIDGFTISGAFGGRSGGGMSVGGPATVRNVVFAGNHAEEGGGALVGHGLPRLIACTFRDNVARARGGALYVYEIRMDSSLVVDNVAHAGGGMYVVGGEDSGSISNTVFLRNLAEADGGAVVNRLRAPRFINVRFIGNSAAGGGAVSNDDATAAFANVEFVGNSATSIANWGEGGAMTNHTSTVSIVNATFSGNSSILPGAAIWNWYSETDVVNSIFWSADGSASQEVANMGDGSRLTMWSSIYEARLDSTIDVAGLILDLDPRFMSPAGPDGVPGTLDDALGLSPNSPAINAGNSAFIPVDIADLDGDGDLSEPLPLDLAGNARVQGGQVDLGAYEAPGSTSTALSPVLASSRACALDVFPNPFGHEVTLSLHSTDPTGLEVYDVLGRLVHTEIILPSTRYLTLGTSNWAKGLFLFRAIHGTEFCSGWVVHK